MPHTFGEFSTLFEGQPDAVPSYLYLLNVGDGTPRAVERLREAALRSGENLDARLCSMLEETDWRPQLVAAVTLVFAGTTPSRIAALWGALDRSCWISSQLAAIACRVDPSFVESAKLRLERRCNLDFRVMYTLVALCEPLQEAQVWLRPLVAAPDVRQLLSSDLANGGRIALAWLPRLDSVVRQAGAASDVGKSG
jgi:hypothetical protein